ncbi:MAG: endolytic transglycosylase MltG [Candidatus Nealsonbacteria bacterium]
MKKKNIIIISVIGFLLLMICLPKNPSSQEEVFFTIEKGEGSKDIAFNLEKKGLVWWSQLFRAYVLVRSTSDELQAGTYRISPSMSILTMAEKFASGDIAMGTVTIPEGFTSEQIFQKLQSVRLAGSDPANLTALQELEGYLFPDTYEIPYGLDLDKIIKIMTDNFNKKTAGPEITPEAIIMASILEKELKTKEDKEIAAGLLWKRIRVGMPLQVDAHMWTYQNRGLPELPICNPGLESIEAALSPKDSLYWYYLSAPDGRTIFSRTLEEHNIAKAKYLK